MDGTNDRQDDSGTGTLGGQKGTSKGTDTLTMEQVEERENKIRSDFKADVGRVETYKKLADEAMKVAEAAEIRTKAMIADREADELLAAQDKPDELAGIRARHTARQAGEELNKVKAELTSETAKRIEAEEKGKKADTQEEAARIAKDTKVSAQDLIDLTDGSTLKMEALAKRLSGGEGKPPLNLDSNKTIGAGASPKEIRDAYIKNPDNPVIYKAYMELRKEQGK